MSQQHDDMTTRVQVLQEQVAKLTLVNLERAKQRKKDEQMYHHHLEYEQKEVARAIVERDAVQKELDVLRADNEQNEARVKELTSERDQLQATLRKLRHDTARDKVQTSMAVWMAKQADREVVAAPRYDDKFADGVVWLDHAEHVVYGPILERGDAIKAHDSVSRALGIPGLSHWLEVTLASKALRAEVERLRTLLRQMVARCRRCNGTGVICLSSLALREPYDRREPRVCPDCQAARVVIEALKKRPEEDDG